MDLTLLRQKLGLAPEATEEEILAKIDSLTDATTPPPSEANAEPVAEATAAEAMANSLAESAREITDLRTAYNALLLDGAVADSRITAAERPAWELRLAGANRAEEMNSLGGLTKKLNSASLDLSARREDRKQGDDLREAVANAISKLQKDEGLTYHEAHLKAKKNAAFKPYFDRSEG